MKKFLSSIIICVMSITSTGTATCFAAEKPPESATICTTQDNINSENEIKDFTIKSIDKAEYTTSRKEKAKAKPSKIKKVIIGIGKLIFLYKFAMFCYSIGYNTGRAETCVKDFAKEIDKGIKYFKGAKEYFDVIKKAFEDNIYISDFKKTFKKLKLVFKDIKIK